jgi:hypothetical protein
MEEYLASCFTMMSKVKKPLAMMSFKYMSTKKKTLCVVNITRIGQSKNFYGTTITCEISKIKKDAWYLIDTPQEK